MVVAHVRNAIPDLLQVFLCITEAAARPVGQVVLSGHIDEHRALSGWALLFLILVAAHERQRHHCQ